jgi:DNA (cytosine-5)-methyltransferase 1
VDVFGQIDELLEAKYRSSDLGNLEDPVAEVVFILLSQQTREAVYREVYTELRTRYATWLQVADLSLKQLEKILRPCGFQRRRSAQLKKLLNLVREDNRSRNEGPWGSGSDLTLSYLSQLTDAEAEAFLTRLPGIGPKSARCVLAYCFSRDVLAVDTHVHRILSRLRLVTSTGRKADHDPFQNAVPASLRRRLHMNLVHHGRAICRTQKPKCGECVLISFCATGRAASRLGGERPVAVDLFAGAGGLGGGFRSAGYHVGLAVEVERNAAQTYRLNNPGVPVLEQPLKPTTTAAALRRLVPGLGDVAVVLAGPPCQGYSVAGSRLAHDPQNELYREAARLARGFRARAIVIENVPGIRRVAGRAYVEPFEKDIRASGFEVDRYLLRASDFGVPQDRQRYFFVGLRGGQPPAAPPATHRANGSGDLLHVDLPRTPRLSDRLDVLPRIEAGVFAERYLASDGAEFFNLSTMAHSKKVVRKIAKIAAGKGPLSYRRLNPEVAHTLIAGHRALPVHPILDRTISVREAALVQGFPLDYVFLGPRSKQPLQVANAVPPPLAAAVALALRPKLVTTFELQ